jgi:hypothetical protein
VPRSEVDRPRLPWARRQIIGAKQGLTTRGALHRGGREGGCPARLPPLPEAAACLRLEREGSRSRKGRASERPARSGV